MLAGEERFPLRPVVACIGRHLADGKLEEGREAHPTDAAVEVSRHCSSARARATLLRQVTALKNGIEIGDASTEPYGCKMRLST